MGGVLYRAWPVFLSERIDANHAAHAAMLPEHATGAWSVADEAPADLGLVNEKELELAKMLVNAQKGTFDLKKLKDSSGSGSSKSWRAGRKRQCRARPPARNAKPRRLWTSWTPCVGASTPRGSRRRARRTAAGRGRRISAGRSRSSERRRET